MTTLDWRRNALAPCATPDARARTVALDRDRDDPLACRATAAADSLACERAIREGSRSFHAASLLLPRDVRRSALALYAFCRVSDDLVDEGNDARATRTLRARLDAIYARAPAPHPSDRAFARVVERHAIPKAVPLALIEGFEWDEAGRRYATIAELHEYGARVASTVGVMMTLIMGPRDPRVLARACDLGLAMQLTNIARDVGEDARNGRLYLPLDWVEDVGLDADGFLAEPRHDERTAEVVRRLLEEAARLYARAGTGVGALPGPCRAAIGAALRIYRAIGHEIAAAKHDSVTRRARTSGRRKALLAAQASATRFASTRLDPSPAMAQVRMLIDAVVAEPLPAPEPRGSRSARAIAVLGRLAERDRIAARAGSR